MTKQSMLELVNKAEASGFVERRTDPDDRRAKIVAFTPAGLEMLDRVREGVAVAERRMAAMMGAGFMSVMNERLAAYVADAIPAPDELRMSARNDVWRMRSVHRVLLSASGAFVRDVLHVVHEGGFDAVSEVNLALFRNLDPGGTRLTEIASRARMTKQAMAELVDKAEQFGLVARRPDPGDGRAKVVVPSQAGLQLLDWHRRGVEAAERRMAAVTGTAFVTALRAQLTAYVAGADAADTEPAWSCQEARLGSPSAAHSNSPSGLSEPSGSSAQTRQGRAAPGPALLKQVDSKGLPLAEFEAEPQPCFPALPAGDTGQTDPPPQFLTDRCCPLR